MDKNRVYHRTTAHSEWACFHHQEITASHEEQWH